MLTRKPPVHFHNVGEGWRYRWTKTRRKRKIINHKKKRYISPSRHSIAAILCILDIAIVLLFPRLLYLGDIKCVRALFLVWLLRGIYDGDGGQLKYLVILIKIGMIDMRICNGTNYGFIRERRRAWEKGEEVREIVTIVPRHLVQEVMTSPNQRFTRIVPSNVFICARAPSFYQDYKCMSIILFFIIIIQITNCRSHVSYNVLLLCRVIEARRVASFISIKSRIFPRHRFIYYQILVPSYLFSEEYVVGHVLCGVSIHVCALQGLPHSGVEASRVASSGYSSINFFPASFH